VDAQLSPALAPWMSAEFGVVAHALRDLDLRDANDREIFERARLVGATVLTKDADFVELLRRRGPPPCVVWLTTGNSSNERVRQLLRAEWARIAERLEFGEGLVEL